MPEPRSGPSDRIDSWKAIAEYLQREERTVRRWEKLGLPVRRVARTRGKSVFAYASEIDAWLKDAGNPAAQSDGPRIGNWGVAAILVALMLAATAWHGPPSTAVSGELTYQFTPSAFIGREPGGLERWRYKFPADEDVYETPRPGAARALPDGEGVIAGINGLKRPDQEPLTGRLFWWSRNGELKRSFSFTRELAFGSGSYGEPWLIVDYAVREEPGTRRVAVAGRQYVWWPAFVTVLNDRWEASGTFVNAGWIDNIHWLSSDRLVISGFSNARNGGMVALLDARALDGQSPSDTDSPFWCRSCGTARPLRYVVMPRTEINVVTASTYNGATLSPSGDRLLVRTMEMPRENRQAPEVLYEFTQSLDLLRASFGDRYWDMHKALEREGKLDHPRERCTDRDGPPKIEVWEPATGWRIIPTR